MPCVSLLDPVQIEQEKYVKKVERVSEYVLQVFGAFVIRTVLAEDDDDFISRIKKARAEDKKCHAKTMMSNTLSIIT